MQAATVFLEIEAPTDSGSSSKIRSLQLKTEVYGQ
jgi:hypothetical protein